MRLTVGWTALATCVFAWGVVGQKYASMSVMKSILEDYFQHAQNIKELLDTNTDFKGKLESIFQDMDKVTDVTDLHHPLNALRIIGHLVSLNNILRRTPNKSSALSTFSATLPYYTDYAGVCGGILRLQQMYGERIDDLIDGVMQGRRAKFGLTHQDVHVISTSAQESKQFATAVDWLTGLNGFDKDTPGLEEAQHFARESELKIFNKVGMYDKSLALAKEMQRLKPGDNNIHQMIEALEKAMKKGQRWDLVLTDQPHTTDSHVDMCRVPSTKLVPREPLVCIYQPALLPYVRYEEEILSMSPRVSLFYNVITEDEVDLFTNRVVTKLERARVGYDVRITSSARIEYTQVIPDTHHTRVAEISRRFSHITGLDASPRPEAEHVTSESWQVCNTGVTGKFDLHYDTIEASANKPEQQPAIGAETRPRVATISIYLSDVERGGEIIFPQLGIHVPVIKRAAVMWYNFNRAGQPYKNTANGLCPLVFGDRWGVFKWLPLEIQTFNRRCGLKVDDEDPLFKQDMSL